MLRATPLLGLAACILAVQAAAQTTSPRETQVIELHRRAESAPGLRRAFVEAVLGGGTALPDLQLYYDAREWARADSTDAARRKDARRLARMIAGLRLLDDKVSAAAMRPDLLRSLDSARARKDPAAGSLESRLYQMNVTLWQGLAPDSLKLPAAVATRMAAAAQRQQAARQRSALALARQQARGDSAGTQGGRTSAPVEGRGSRLFANGDRYTGEFHLGTPHGRGVYETAGGIRFEGQFVDGAPSGIITLDLPSGTRYVGPLANGHRTGEGTLELPTGDRYIGQFVSDLFEGQGILEYASGGRYLGQWHAGKREGKGVEEYANGRVLHGRFADDRVVEPDDGEPVTLRRGRT